VKKGQIFKIHSDFYYVRQGDEIFECKIREVLKKQKQAISVGDFVEFDGGVISKVLPRNNFIARPKVANIDQVVVVSAVKEPDLDFTQLDRYIALAKYYNIPTKLCFNKNDLSLNDDLIEKVFSIYEPLGFDIVFTSALEKFGIDEFLEILKGKTTVFCGTSGAGKSSLINAINPNLNLKTKSVSEKTSRGTHTTRHCEIIDIAEDTRIVDTPGFSNMKFDFLLPTEVQLLFDEIKELNQGCKFSDCLHVHETGCVVLENLEQISTSRYNSYLTFVDESKEYKEKVKFQGIKTESSSKLHNDSVKTKISARKRLSARNTLKQRINKENHDE